MAFLHLNDVSLEFPVYEIAGRSLKVSLFNHVVGAPIEKRRGAIMVQGLSNITLRLEDGDRVGLIGSNGAGKSTLLRVMAGVARPQKGTVSVQGRVTPLLYQGLGINPDLTGRQNIATPMRLLGASEEEVAAALEDIPDWTGLGAFIDLPLKTYSAGMKARLLFAICTASAGDIMLLDEWLSAGDQDFVAKANQRVRDMLERTSIVVLASHSNDIIRTICNKAVWMDKGEIVAVGETEDILHRYTHGLREIESAEEPN